MYDLKIWFLDVGHGDSTFIILPNGARMLIDCGCGEDHWPSTLLTNCDITPLKPVQIPGETRAYGLDNLVITHPHGDHLADIQRIHEQVKFFLLTGSYRDFIDKIAVESIDFRQRGQDAAKAFIKIVKEYCGTYEEQKDRVRNSKPTCIVEKRRFIEYSDGMDLNELSWFISISIANHKVLFTGDMTATGVRRILNSARAEEFSKFVAGTTILKVPHHGRENGCSEEMFDLFGGKPLACVVSDEVLNDRNEGTSNIEWYGARTSDIPVSVNGTMVSRKVFTTRNDGDIFLSINHQNHVQFQTNVFADLRKKIYGH
jgi:L-ascorbate metabolism protein UlaG (beta-lactamase superfamily)